LTNRINIDLWFWNLEATTTTLARWSSYLSVDEEARRARFMFEKDRARYAICRSRMRRILGWYTQTPPRAIKFETVGREKPVLDSSQSRRVHFNLTHTTGLACLAVTPSNAVGIDLEQVRDLEDDFIAHTLNTAEQEMIMPLKQEERPTAFLRTWTAKEAYLKCIGSGLWQSLKTFDVQMPEPTASGEFSLGTLPRIDDAAQRVRNWQLYTFQATQEHIGALAIAPPEGSVVEIRTRWIGASQAS